MFKLAVFRDLRRIANTALFALLVVFATNSGAFSAVFPATDTHLCSVDIGADGILTSDNSNVFRALWCHKCSANALRSTTCQLTTPVVNGTCDYGTIDCKIGYETLHTEGDGQPYNSVCEPIHYDIHYYPGEDVDSFDTNPDALAHPYYTVESNFDFQGATAACYKFKNWVSYATTPSSKVTGIRPKTNPDPSELVPLNLYASWEKAKYYLYYDCGDNLNGGEIDPRRVTCYDDEVLVPRVSRSCSEYNGYDPNGWYCTADNNTDVSNRFIEGTFIEEWDIPSNVHCSAQWVIHPYPITYKDGNTVLTGLMPDTYSVENLPIIDKDVTYPSEDKIGYSFEGWCREPEKQNCSDNLQIVAPNPLGEVTLYADWQIKHYPIHYELYGGTNGDNPDTYTVEDEVELREPTKTGYTFLYWTVLTGQELEDAISTLDNIETEEEYEAAASAIYISGWHPGERHDEEGLTLHAHWSANTYEIEYADISDENWEQGSTHPSYYTPDDLDIYISQPIRDGYDFLGWCEYVDDCDEPISQYVIEHGSTEDILLVPRWRVQEFEIRYIKNDNDESDWSGIYSHTDSYTINMENLVIDTLSRPGWSFDGWTDNFNHSEEPVMHYVVDTSLRAPLVLTAHWSIKTDNIYYELNGGTFGDQTAKTTYNYTETFTLLTPTRDGYNFEGWCLNAEECEPPNKNFTVTAGNFYGNLTFYARWTPLSYSVTYACDADAASIRTTNVNYDAEYDFITNINSIGEPLCQKTGYDFGGWNCSYTDGNNNTVSVASVHKDHWNVLYNVHCVPDWQETSFTVSFRPNSGPNSGPSAEYVQNSMTTITCSYTDGCVLPANQYVYPAHDFIGWVASDSTTYEDEDTIKEKTEDIILYAQWTTARIHCDAGTYLPKNTLICEPCKQGFYCPEGYWTFSTTQDNGALSCKRVILNNNATSEPGSSTEQDCYLPCVEKTGYNLSEEHNVVHYGSNETCEYFATIVYTGNNSCAAQQQTYTYSNNATVDLCVPKDNQNQEIDAFIGWIDNNGTSYTNFSDISINSFSPQNGVVTMTPVWRNYNLTYDCGVDNKIVVVDNLDYGYTVSLSDYNVCDVAGYTFNGWACDDINGILQSGDTFTMPDKNVSCVAQITPNHYTIKFNKNATEATGSMQDMENISYAESVPLTANAFERRGYDFNGWCDNWNSNLQTCVGKRYSNSQSVQGLVSTDGGTITLYATWKTKRYTITYTTSIGGTIATSNPSYYYVTTPTFQLGNPSALPDGYSFDGWCDDNGCSTQKVVEQGTVGDLVFTAKLEPITYTINYAYVFNGVVTPLDIEPTSYTIVSGATFPTDVTIPGYTFQGWFMDRNLRSGPYTRLTNATGNKTVYAKVKKLSCAMNEFIQNGVCTPCGSHSYSNGGYATECICDDNYINQAGECVAESYTITYYFNGGALPSGLTNPSTYTVEDVNRTLNEPVKDNAVFQGWKRYSNLTGNNITTIPGGLTGNLNLYASWKSCDQHYHVENDRCILNVYNITYRLNGGDLPVGETNPSTFTINSAQTTLKEPVKANYMFAGWYLNSDFSGVRITSVPGSATSDITLYARWQEDLGTSEITYDCGNGNVIHHTEHIGLAVSLADNTECQITNGVLSGWMCDGTEYSLTDDIIVPYTDLTCSAIVTEQAPEYDIIYKAFDADDNEFDLSFVTPKKYTTDPGVVYPTDVNIPGYEFKGWYLDRSLRSGSRTYRTPSNSSGTITLYGRFDPAIIHCDAGSYLPVGSLSCSTCRTNKYCTGGDYKYSTDLSQGEQTCESPYSYAVPGTTSANKCYKSCDERNHYNVVGIQYRDGTSTCEYELKTYYITYVLNGGVFNGDVENPRAYNITSPRIVSLPKPERSDKLFDKWVDANGTEVTFINTRSGGDKTLYAQWKIKPCEENQYLSGETCLVCPDGLYSEGGYVTECGCRPGYVKTVSSWVSEIYPASGVRISSYSSSGNTWHTDVVPGTWMHDYADGLGDCRSQNGSTGAVWNDNNEIESGKYCWCQMTSPYETKWIYSGMNNSSRCQELCADTCGARSKTNSGVRNALFGSAYTDGGADHEITSCEPIEYDILYIGLEGATHTNPKKYTVEDAGLRFTPPTNRVGFVFTGWTKRGVAFTEIPQGLKGDIVLTANWAELSCDENEFIENNTCVPCGVNSHSDGGEVYTRECNDGYEKLFDVCVATQYNIDYVYNGGYMPSGTTNPISYNIETPIITLNAPAKSHNNFIGWYDTPEFNGAKIEHIDPATTQRNITLYAKWSFVCESGKWMRIGNERMCLYSEKETSPSMVLDVRGTPYYIMLSEDSEKPVHDGSGKKMHIEYGGSTYNAHDASVN